MNEIEEFTPPHPLNTAVLIMVFNRIDTTKQVFKAIRQAKPPRLYIAADDARQSRPGEKEKVKEVRDYVMSHIDWECEVKTLFREKHLGCKYSISGAITWFFENEEIGIILEDDCLPNQSFFWFCEELLERYKDDMRVGQISGFNFGYMNEDLNYDYFFSKYPQIWGWATWRNRWCKYDTEMSKFDEIIKNGQLKHIFMKSEYHEIKEKLQKAKNGLIDTWDYQWSLTLYINRQYSIIPRLNLIRNLGFDRDDALHTKGKNPYLKIDFNIQLVPKNHPQYILEFQSYYDYITKKSFISKIKALFV